MNDFVSGMVCMGCLVVGLFFLRFWRQSGDRLLLYFALSFWVYAGQRVAVAFIPAAAEDRLIQYLFRLGSFVLILIGIIDKNWRRPR